MALKSFYMDNTNYDSDDVNAAFAALIVPGVQMYTVTGNATTDFNTAISKLVSSGVDNYNIDACKVYADGNTYKVKKGICWLPDGSRIEVDDDEYELSLPDTGDTIYVYAWHNTPLNVCEIVASASAGGEDTVSLATIGSDGSVTDTRKYATAKVNMNVATTKVVDFEFSGGEEQGDTMYYGTATISVPTSDWQACHIVCRGYDQRRTAIDKIVYREKCPLNEDGTRSCSYTFNSFRKYESNNQIKISIAANGVITLSNAIALGGTAVIFGGHMWPESFDDVVPGGTGKVEEVELE